MRYVRMIALILLAALTGAVCEAAPSVRMPALQVGSKVFSNALVTASGKTRLLVEHDGGLTSVNVSELSFDTVRELHEGGIVSDGVAKEILRKAPKKEVVKAHPAENQSEASGTNSPAAGGRMSAKKGSIAGLLGAEVRKEARLHGADMDARAFVTILPIAWQCILTGLLIAAWLCRRCLYYRIVETATGHSSLLVFAPVFRWIPLTNAANLSLQWLLIPLFAIVGLFVPPVLGDLPWIILGYYSLVGLLWLGTAILYAVWCVRLCQAVNRTGWLGILLMLPLIDWIALFILASSSGRPEVQAQGADSKRLVLAI